MSRRVQKASGFTLIEVLLVIGILLVLGTVGVIGYSKIKANADKDTAKALVDQTCHAVDLYQIKLGTFPKTEDGLKALCEPPSDEKDAEKWNNGGGPFLKDKKIPVDPWGNELHYRTSSRPLTMTSRTGQKRSSPRGQHPHPALRATLSLQGRGAAGFTLFEIVLAIGLVLVLMGVVLVSYASWSRTTKMEEGVFQFQAALRMARSESANTGKKFRMEFDQTSGAFKVTCEASPLAEPGVFQDYSGSPWATNLPTDCLKASACRLTGSSAYAPQASEFILKSTQATTLPSITFYPDGSCDSAVIELQGTDQAEGRTAVVTLDGVNRLVSANIMMPTELQEYHDQLAEGGP